jgi:hypothetical protein
MKNTGENITREQLFQKIADASLFGNLNLFIGTGFSMSVFENSITERPLSWIELLDKVCEKEKIILDDKDKKYSSCPEIASKISQKILENNSDKLKTLEEASNELKAQISVLTAWYPNQEQRDDYSQILKNLEPNYIITTNYDLILENLLPENSISLGPNDILTSPKFEIPIYHLHGIRTDPSSIIITKEDYTKLFRPNEYRLQKLSLLFKESTTLIIGYSLGDTNVLTALDWSENIYKDNSRKYYPNGIIQLLYKRDNPNPEPIIQENGIITLEIDSILDIMKELSDFIERNKEKYSKEKLEINNFRSKLINADDNLIKSFIDDKNRRIDYINKIQENSRFIIEAFLQFLTKVFDECWDRAKERNNFEAYNEFLLIILDILIKIPFSKMSPALFESMAYNLGTVSSYIGSSVGQSYAANNTWNKNKSNIQSTTKKELQLYYKQRNQYNMLNLLK